MSARWVAAVVRARAEASRQLGRAAVRSLAGSRDLDQAVARLAAGPYGFAVHPGQDLAEAQRGVAATFLWNTRVLAGWLPPGGAEVLRVMSGWAEIANVEGLLASFARRGAAGPPYELGTLRTAWPRLAGATNRTDLAQRLTTSAWGDPGRDDEHAIGLALRLTWCQRVRSIVPAAAAWAEGAAALVLARELLTRSGATEAPDPRVVAVLGPAAAEAATVEQLRAALPGAAGWALAGAGGAGDLWLAEAAWWQRVQTDAARMVTSTRFDLTPVIGVVALLAVDAWRVRAALELAARGGRPLEVFDAVV